MKYWLILILSICRIKFLWAGFDYEQRIFNSNSPQEFLECISKESHHYNAFLFDWLNLKIYKKIRQLKKNKNLLDIPAPWPWDFSGVNHLETNLDMHNEKIILPDGISYGLDNEKKIIVPEKTRRFYRESTYIHNFMLLEKLKGNLEVPFNIEIKKTQIQVPVVLQNNSAVRRYIVGRTRKITLKNARVFWQLDVFVVQGEIIQNRAVINIKNIYRFCNWKTSTMVEAEQKYKFDVSNTKNLLLKDTDTTPWQMLLIKTCFPFLPNRAIKNNDRWQTKDQEGNVEFWKCILLGEYKQKEYVELSFSCNVTTKDQGVCFLEHNNLIFDCSRGVCVYGYGEQKTCHLNDKTIIDSYNIYLGK